MWLLSWKWIHDYFGRLLLLWYQAMLDNMSAVTLTKALDHNVSLCVVGFSDTTKLLGNENPFFTSTANVIRLHLSRLLALLRCSELLWKDLCIRSPCWGAMDLWGRILINTCFQEYLLMLEYFSRHLCYALNLLFFLNLTSMSFKSKAQKPKPQSPGLKNAIVNDTFVCVCVWIFFFTSAPPAP